MIKKPLAYLLIAALILTVGINVYQYNQNLGLSKQKDDVNTRQEMLSLLTGLQFQINGELEKLDQALQSACGKLSTAGLQGSQARATLSELVANNSLIVNAAASDINDILVAVEPSTYNSIEGEDISGQEQNMQLHQTMRPAMSNMIPLVEGFNGVVMVAPIFDVSGKFMGALSIVIQPSILLKAAIAPAKEDTSYSMWAMQTNGTLIYDPDPAQQGRNLLTDPIYLNYTEVQVFTRHVSDEQAGYGTYQYYNTNLDDASGHVVSKEAYWATIGIYGAQWRLVVVHITSE